MASYTKSIASFSDKSSLNFVSNIATAAKEPLPIVQNGRYA